jgi:hypothetical protein
MLGEVDLVEMAVIPAESPENVGGIPVGEVVDHRWMPLSCRAIRRVCNA